MGQAFSSPPDSSTNSTEVPVLYDHNLLPFVSHEVGHRDGHEVTWKVAPAMEGVHPFGAAIAAVCFLQYHKTGNMNSFHTSSRELSKSVVAEYKNITYKDVKAWWDDVNNNYGGTESVALFMNVVLGQYTRMMDLRDDIDALIAYVSQSSQPFMGSAEELTAIWFEISKPHVDQALQDVEDAFVNYERSISNDKSAQVNWNDFWNSLPVGVSKHYAHVWFHSGGKLAYDNARRD